MPALGPLMLRYVLWLVLLRVLYTLVVNMLGVGQSLSTTVILAAAPAIDIGMQVVRRSTVSLTRAQWAKVWGLLVATYLFIAVLAPAVLLPGFRLALATPDGLQTIATLSAATAAFLALFLYLGTRAGAGRAR